jgi:hypothetical protein
MNIHTCKTEDLDLINRVKDAGKFVPVYAMKVYMGNRGIAPLIINLGPSWR